MASQGVEIWTTESGSTPSSSAAPSKGRIQARLPGKAPVADPTPHGAPLSPSAAATMTTPSGVRSASVSPVGPGSSKEKVRSGGGVAAEAAPLPATAG